MFTSFAFNLIYQWTYSTVEHKGGSVYDMKWSGDGLQLALANGDGSLALASVIGRKIDVANYEILLSSSKAIDIYETTHGYEEHLEFKESVVQFSFKFGHLIVATTNQVYIHSEQHWNTPHILDIPNVQVTTVRQAGTCFLLADMSNSVQLYNYDGKLLSSFKLPSNILTSETGCSVSNETILFRDLANEKTVHVYDLSGKALGPFKHSSEITNIHLFSTQNPRVIFPESAVILDKNKDMYLLDILKRDVKKIVNMTSCAVWHDTYPILASMSDGAFRVWYFPVSVFVDTELLHLASFTKDAQYALLLSYTSLIIL